MKAADWLNGSPECSYTKWLSRTGGTSRELYLTKKYSSIWRRKLKGKKTKRRDHGQENGEDEDNWLRLLLFTPSSKAVRQTTCSILENLCQVMFLFTYLLCLKRKRIIYKRGIIWQNIRRRFYPPSDIYSRNMTELINSPNVRRHLERHLDQLVIMLPREDEMRKLTSCVRKVVFYCYEMILYSYMACTTGKCAHQPSILWF